MVCVDHFSTLRWKVLTISALSFHSLATRKYSNIELYVEFCQVFMTEQAENAKDGWDASHFRLKRHTSEHSGRVAQSRTAWLPMQAAVDVHPLSPWQGCREGDGSPFLCISYSVGAKVRASMSQQPRSPLVLSPHGPSTHPTPSCPIQNPHNIGDTSHWHRRRQAANGRWCHSSDSKSLPPALHVPYSMFMKPAQVVLDWALHSVFYALIKE